MRVKVVLAATALAGAGAAWAQSGSGDPAANWAQVAACAQLDSADARHACVDNVLRATGLLDRQTEVAQQRETFGQTRRPDPAPPPPPPVAPPAPAAVTPSAALPPAAAVAAAPPVLDQIETTVTRAFDPGNRLMVVITAEGQVWQQSERKDIGLPPRAGARFVVEKGSLGSFNCRIGGGRTFRCRRHD
jgi:hypothetical protein